MSKVTCIIVSHRKPEYVKEAVDSVLNQSLQDWDAILVDSGSLYNKGFFNWIKDTRIKVIPSGETPEMKKNTAMAPWCFNECFRKKLVKGNLVTYLCDDDVWYKNAFEVFDSFASRNPEIEAMYASQDVAMHDREGNRFIVGERRALSIMGLAAKAQCMDCHVDYLQFCHTRKIIEKIANNWPDHSVWPEGKITETHADGVFMDRIGSITPVFPIDIKVGQNRRTPLSTYVPSR